MTTLSLAMIVKNEGDTIERVLGCVKDFCDEMIVVDTGSTDDTVAKAEAMGAKVYHFKWIDDFSAARNYAFSMATQEWIMWLDGDDVIDAQNQKNIAAIKASRMKDDELEVIFTYYDVPPFLQWRERFIRRRAFENGAKWYAPIHECIAAIDFSKSERVGNITIRHDTPINRGPAKKDRNISILRKHFEDHSDDERYVYQYALEAVNGLKREEAQKVLTHFFGMSQNKSYQYELYIRMHAFHLHFEEPEKALNVLGKAISLDPARAEALYLLGKYRLNTFNDHISALSLLTTAFSLSPPEHAILVDPDSYTYGPLLALSSLYFRMHDLEFAQELAKTAMVYSPPYAQWHKQLLDYNPKRSEHPPLPEDWQEWLERNTREGFYHYVLMRLLEEAGFSPAQIVGGMKLLKEKDITEKTAPPPLPAHFKPMLSACLKAKKTK